MIKCHGDDAAGDISWHDTLGAGFCHKRAGVAKLALLGCEKRCVKDPIFMSDSDIVAL